MPVQCRLNAGSSNGKTCGFEPQNGGSIPSPAFGPCSSMEERRPSKPLVARLSRAKGLRECELKVLKKELMKKPPKPPEFLTCLGCILTLLIVGIMWTAFGYILVHTVGLTIPQAVAVIVIVIGAMWLFLNHQLDSV